MTWWTQLSHSSVGPGAFLAKIDIEHAYKLIPIHPADIPALGIRWFGDWLWDCTLPIGSRSGSAIFEAFSHAIQFLLEARGWGDMSHVLDDFLMVSPDKHISDNRLSRFLALCELLGIPVVWEKTESGTCIIFLGITLDTIKMEARLPQEKLDKCLRLITAYRQLQKISVKQLESLTGLLNFACKVIHPGRPFLRRLYNLMEGFRRRLPFYKLCLTAGAKEDLRMLDIFLRQFNGVTMFLPTSIHTQKELSTQLASNSSGWAIVKSSAWAKGRWGSILQGKWPNLIQGILPLVGLIHVFGDSLSNCRLHLQCQNLDVAQILTCQTHKDPQIMHVICKWVLSLLYHNISVTQNIPNHLALSLLSIQVQHGSGEASTLEPQPRQNLPPNWPIGFL